jgi:hypothetical protein
MPKKSERFTMRLSPQDKQIFAELAAQLHRTESDAIRIVTREFVAAMKATTPTQIGQTQVS